MNAVAVVVQLLRQHGPLAALVSVDSIMAGTVPLGEQLPVIGVTEVGRRDFKTVAQDERATWVSARVQVTVYAKDYPTQKGLLLAAKLGPGMHAGRVAGVKVHSVRRLEVGPDLSDEAADIYQQSRDFMVAYLEQNS